MVSKNMNTKNKSQQEKMTSHTKNNKPVTKKKSNAKSTQVSALFTPKNHSTTPDVAAAPTESKVSKPVTKRTAVKKPKTPPSTAAVTPEAPSIKKNAQERMPSRSALFDVIRTHAIDYKKPLTTIQIAQELDVLPAQVGTLQSLLDQMVSAGDIKMNPKGTYTALSNQPLLSGQLQVSKDGYGFLIQPDAEDVFIAAHYMNGAWHGDTITVRVTGTARSGKREGEVVEVIKRKTDKVVGHLIKENGVWLVSPEDVRLNADILVDGDELMGAKAGQVVVVTLKQYGDQHTMPMGRIVEVLGNADDPGMEIEIAVRKFDVPHVFSEATERQVAQLADTVSDAEWSDRVDLRDVPLVTIDGEDARDFDDAVYCELIKSGRKVTGYRLLVAIADVSHYVKDRTALNEDALTRATSVYFPRRVVPMLPEKLSNGLCSLNPHVNRLCMVADMVIDLEGQVTAYQFYEAVMYSAARLTYNQVWEYLEQGTGYLVEQYKPLTKQVQYLYDVYKVLLQAREVRGAMEFETVETYIVSDEEGKIKEILPRTRNDAHRLIEECMLAANVCAAEFIEQSGRLSLYRNHEGPTPEKLEALRKSLQLVGLKMGGGDKPTPKDYAAIMKQVNERPDAAGLQTLLLRSMQQAVYAPDNLGHFGLAYEAYTHFTSPIRRYPDLLVHRTIKSILAGQRYTPVTDQIVLLEDTRKKKPWVDEAFNKAEKSVQHKAQNDASHLLWEKLGGHASMCERRADEASRDVTAWLKCEYMKQFIGEEMLGRISGLTSFGAFVTLNDVYVDGLIHISELGQDYFEFDEASYCLRGRASGKIYRLNDEITVQIAGVDSDLRRVDFALPAANKTSTNKNITGGNNNRASSRGSSSTRSAASDALANSGTRGAGSPRSNPVGNKGPKPSRRKR